MLLELKKKNNCSLTKIVLYFGIDYKDKINVYVKKMLCNFNLKKSTKP